MKFSEWEPIYLRICGDFGFSPDSDAMSVRMLKAVTPNSDLRDEDSIRPLIGSTVTVMGDSPGLEEDISKLPPEGCVIASGSSVLRLLRLGIMPQIVVLPTPPFPATAMVCAMIYSPNIDWGQSPLCLTQRGLSPMCHQISVKMYFCVTFPMVT